VVDNSVGFDSLSFNPTASIQYDHEQGTWCVDVDFGVKYVAPFRYSPLRVLDSLDISIN